MKDSALFKKYTYFYYHTCEILRDESKTNTCKLLRPYCVHNLQYIQCCKAKFAGPVYWILEMLDVKATQYPNNLTLKLSKTKKIYNLSKIIFYSKKKS